MKIINAGFPLYVMIFCLFLLVPLSGSAEERRLGISEAIQEALVNNLNLKLTKEQLVASIGVTQSAEGTFDTTFNANISRANRKMTPLISGAAEEEDTTFWRAGLQKTFTPGTIVSLAWDNSQLEARPQAYLFDPAYSTGLTLSLTQPLLQGFGKESQTTAIRAAKKQEEASALVVESRSANLAAEVIYSYWDLVFSWQDIDVKKLSLTLAQKLLEETKDRIDAGKLADVELFRPQSEVALREESLIFAERAIGLAEDRLKILLNSDKWHVSIIPTDLPNVGLQQLNINTIEDNTMQSRPDLKASRLSAEAAEIALQKTKDKTRSSLALFGSVGISGTDESYSDSLDNLAGDSDTNWQIGLTFSRPLDNSFAHGQQIQAEAAARQAHTTVQILEQDIRRSVRAALRDVNLAVKNMEATRKTSLASLKGLEAEQTKFNAGRGTTLDVLVAQERYSNALSQEKLARINYAKTLAELDRIQGIIHIAEK